MKSTPRPNTIRRAHHQQPATHATPDHHRHQAATCRRMVASCRLNRCHTATTAARSPHAAPHRLMPPQPAPHHLMPPQTAPCRRIPPKAAPCRLMPHHITSCRPTPPHTATNLTMSPHTTLCQNAMKHHEATFEQFAGEKHRISARTHCSHHCPFPRDTTSSPEKSRNRARGRIPRIFLIVAKWRHNVFFLPNYLHQTKSLRARPPHPIRGCRKAAPWEARTPDLEVNSLTL